MSTAGILIGWVVMIFLALAALLCAFIGLLWLMDAQRQRRGSPPAHPAGRGRKSGRAPVRLGENSSRILHSQPNDVRCI